MSGSSRSGQSASAQTGEIERRLHTLEKRLNEIGPRASTNSQDIVGGLSEVIASAPSTWADRFRQGAYGRRSISGTWQRCSEAWNNRHGSNRRGKSTAAAGGGCGRIGRGSSCRYGHTGVVQVRGVDDMNKNRVERTLASDLAGQVQENASELVRSVGDVAGKFIQEQPFTATLIALGIGWLLGRTHRPL
jgi:hypothetical protein